MCVRASVVLMQCTLAHHVKFVRASCVNFHTLPNSNQGQIRSNLISHVFILNTNFNGHQFLVAKSALNGRNATVFALRFCGPPSWMRERVRSRIKSRPSAIAVGDTKWDRVIKIWGIRSHEWHYQPQGTCSHTDLYKNLNIWHLVNQLHPETPWQFGVLCVQC